ncbi:MAG: ATP-dependent 6-phosphofructokinase [Armatimonadetes bacterium]|nr:ATP-dependent 6-phosphofructokinase [Armatimonadota bacterium]
MRVGVLTGGGDCPGLNPAIRGVVMRGLQHGFEFVGLELGWKGLLEKRTVPLNLEVVEDIIRLGGTMLGSSRTNPFRKDRAEDAERCVQNFRELGLDALVALGGEDTLGVAHKMFRLGLPTVGVPKTMDNDLEGTDCTFGVDSAVSVAVDAADRLIDTGKSHRRIMVLEVMGRHAGWVALYTGLAAGADWILIPEVPVDLEEMCRALRAKWERGRHTALVVASEGIELPVLDTEDITVDAFGHVTLKQRRVAEFLAHEIEERVGIETRYAVLGHIQRGGAPTAFDRILGTRVGLRAADLVRDQQWGMMAALRGTEVIAVPLEHAVARLKTVPLELYEEAKSIFSQ